MLDIYLRIPIADPHASCVPWVNYFNFSVPHFLIHKMGVIVGTTHISVRNIIYTSIYGQLSSVAQSCLTLCDPIDCSMPGLPVHHQLPELSQLFTWSGQSIGISASASVLPVNTQD